MRQHSSQGNFLEYIFFCGVSAAAMWYVCSNSLLNTYNSAIFCCTGAQLRVRPVKLVTCFSDKKEGFDSSRWGQCLPGCNKWFRIMLLPIANCHKAFCKCISAINVVLVEEWRCAYIICSCFSALNEPEQKMSISKITWSRKVPHGHNMTKKKYLSPKKILW